MVLSLKVSFFVIVLTIVINIAKSKSNKMTLDFNRRVPEGWSNVSLQFLNISIFVAIVNNKRFSYNESVWHMGIMVYGNNWNIFLKHYTLIILKVKDRRQILSIIIIKLFNKLVGGTAGVKKTF